MPGDIQELVTQKYERNGWPAQRRPDLKPPAPWTLEFISTMDRPRAHVISPDGGRIALFWDRADGSNLYVMPAAGGWPAPLTFDRDPVAYWADDPPRWSPDGEWLAYTSGGHVWVIPSAGGKAVNVSALTTGASSPRWLPDSTHVLISASRDEHGRILLADREGGWPRQITSGPGHDHSAQPSPDGTRVVYVYQPPDDLNRSDIRLTDIASGDTTELTGTPGYHDGYPAWSPDGKRIAYLSERPGHHMLFVYDLYGETERQITDLDYDVVEFAWSPDGTRILATINRDGAFHLALIDPASGAVEDLLTGYGVHAYPRWLPDGNSITFEYEDAQNPPDIYRMDLASGALTQLTFSKAPLLDGVDLVVPEHVTYRSFDGLEIPAFLYRPAKSNGAAVVHPHGGPTSAYVLEWDIVAQYFVAKGYTWLAPNFRGSTGYGIDFERANHGVWGVKDTEDCLAAADYLAEMDTIDADRIAIFGASYGSYMAVTSLAYDDQHRFACGVAKYGDCNILSSWAQGDQIGREDLERMMKHPSQDRAGYHAGSPVWRADEIERPLFIAHGLLDDRVHPLQSEELVETLKREGKTYEYITYVDEGHGILRRGNRLDFHTRLERFFDWWLI